jgi:hypothetical protein
MLIIASSGGAHNRLLLAAVAMRARALLPTASASDEIDV